MKSRIHFISILARGGLQLGGELIKGCIFLCVWVDGPINGAGGREGYGLTGLTGLQGLKAK